MHTPATACNNSQSTPLVLLWVVKKAFVCWQAAHPTSLDILSDDQPFVVGPVNCDEVKVFDAKGLSCYCIGHTDCQVVVRQQGGQDLSVLKLAYFESAHGHVIQQQRVQRGAGEEIRYRHVLPGDELSERCIYWRKHRERRRLGRVEASCGALASASELTGSSTDCMLASSPRLARRHRATSTC